MSKKLMLLAAGALAALAFAALPAVAAAKEYNVDCSKATCKATVAGTSTAEDPIELENDNGEKVDCGAVGGSVAITSGTSKGTTELSFTSCKETISGFNFSCSGGGGGAGEIKTGALNGDVVNLEDTSTTPGLLITNVNVTFSCAGGLVTKTVTGSVLGHIENPECGKEVSSHSVTFGKIGVGSQAWKQVTTTGTVFDLTSGTHSSDLTTSSQTGTGKLTWEVPTKITC